MRYVYDISYIPREGWFVYKVYDAVRAAIAKAEK